MKIKNKNFQKKFFHKVLNAVQKIPLGKTMTYGEIAALAGNPKAARAVGSILKQNYNLKIPCHRVIRADGSAGGYNRGAKNKIALLRKEGAII